MPIADIPSNCFSPLVRRVGSAFLLTANTWIYTLRHCHVGCGTSFITLFILGDAAIVEGKRMARIEFDGLVVVLDGAVELTFPPVGVAAIVEVIRIVRIELNRLLVVLDGAVELTFLP